MLYRILSLFYVQSSNFVAVDISSRISGSEKNYYFSSWDHDRDTQVSQNNPAGCLNLNPKFMKSFLSNLSNIP